MGTGLDQVSRAEALAALAWFVDAGVDELVTEAPRDWFAPLRTRTASVARSDIDVRSAPVSSSPQTGDFLNALAEVKDPTLLDSFVAEHPASPFREGRTRLLTHEVTRAELAIVIDWPAVEDNSPNDLMSGPAGDLLDRMLAAIGLSRTSVLLTSLLPHGLSARQRPAQKLLDAGIALVRHRLRLVGTRRALVMGGAAQLLFDLPPLAARGTWRSIGEGEDGDIQTLVTLAPAFLLAQPAQKGRAWEDLQLFVKGPCGIKASP